MFPPKLLFILVGLALRLIIINVEVYAVQYHVFIGRFCHASRFQTGLAGLKPRLIPGHFDYFTVSNVYTQKL